MKVVNNQIPEIQAFRAIAILSVALFHFFSRWTVPHYKHIYPWPKGEAFQLIFENGFLGVQFFFVISGFVIFITLESKPNAKRFLLARAKRLYPSIFIALPFLYIFCTILNQDFISPLKIKNLIASMMFFDPAFLNSLGSYNFRAITGVLWSLWVEVSFYFLVAVLYFRIRKLIFLDSLVISGVFLSLLQVVFYFKDVKTINPALDTFFAIRFHIWWFIGGVAFSMLFQNSENIKARIVCFCSFLLSIFFLVLGSLNDPGISTWHISVRALLGILIYFMFFLLIFKRVYLGFLIRDKILFIGSISYEFYLIHEAFGVSILSYFSSFQESRLYYLLLIPIFSLTYYLSKLINFISIRLVKFLIRIYHL